MQSVLTLTPTGPQLGQSLGFTAASVTVDNLTPEFLQLTDVGRTIPPWFVGVVVPLPDGIRQANASLVATSPAAPGPTVPKQQCTLTWSDQVLAADPGHPLSQAGYGVSTLVLTLDAGVGQDVTKFLDLPAGTLSVAVKTTVTSGSVVRPAILSVGDRAGTSYLVQSPVNTGAWAFVSVVDAAGLEVELNNNVGAGTTAFETLVYASPLPLQGSPLPVSGTVSISGTVAVSQKALSWDGVADSGEVGAGVQATCTLAGVASRIWICRQIDAQMASSAAPAATAIRIRLRDGASGVGAILRSWTMSVPAVAGQVAIISISGLAIKGTAGNAMTLEFSALIANVFENCGFGADQL
jgi:hypothetical protein